MTVNRKDAMAAEIQQLTERAFSSLVDEEAIAHFGSRLEANFQVLIALGLSDGDLVEEDAPPQTPLDDIRRWVAKALQLKAEGWATSDILVRGLEG